MSTGDQSQYIRSKIAQRGLERGAHFMEDGFDRWAESTAPARVGQMDKMGSEPMAENYGGAMTLKHAKKLHMRGGMSGGLIPIPAEIQRAIDEAKKLATMWRSVSTWLDELRMELQDEVIENPDAPDSYKRVARNLLAVLDSVKSIQSVLDAAASFVGSGRGSLRGGATVVEQITQAAQKIYQAYGWLRDNKAAITGVLGLRALQPIGNKVLDVIKPIFSAIGLGRGGKKCAEKYCMCEGGALPVYDVNSGTMETKPNANRKKGGRRMSCSSEEMGTRKVGGNKLMDASPQAQSQMMKEITGMGRKRGGVGLLEKLELMNPADRKHYEYETVIKPSRVVGGRKHGGAMLAPGPRLRPPTAAQQQAASDRDRKHKEMVMSGEYDRMMAEKMAGRPSQVFGGRGMEPRSIMTFPESMGSGKSKMKLPRKVGGKSCGGKKPSARGEVVKKVMREQGLSLPQASKYVKEHGLY